MTIARRHTTPLESIGIALPSPTTSPPLAAPRDIPISPRDIPAAETIAPAGRLRRCTFRRIDRVGALPGRVPLPTYEIMCLYTDRESPLALGDVAAAQPFCQACTASGIFRPDEA